MVQGNKPQIFLRFESQHLDTSVVLRSDSTRGWGMPREGYSLFVDQIEVFMRYSLTRKILFFYFMS